MRLSFYILPLLGTVLFLGACNKASKLARDAGDFRQVADDSPTVEAKSDRPTEAGEGLPGYLIDPAKVVVEVKDGTYTISGNVGAVLNGKGENTIATVTLIKISKAAPQFKKHNSDWQMEGTVLMSSPSAVDGSFHVLGAISSADLLFIKAAATESAVIHYVAINTDKANLWIDGTTARILDTAVAAQIVSQVAVESSSLARAVEQLKTTGKCRNCNLRGAELSNLSLPNCDLSFSDLTGAKVRSTNLDSCSFQNSNLSQVDFTQSILSNANLTQTDITGAIFVGAKVDGVVGQQISPQ